MTEVNIYVSPIAQFRDRLGEKYDLVEVIFEKVSKQYFCLDCVDPLPSNEIPLGICTDFKKILLACISISEGQEAAEFTRLFILDVYKEFNLSHGTNIAVRRGFFISAVLI